MACWAIGDVQGCWRSLEALLATIGFADSRDRLWFTGDLVNRGPGSLEVLRWAAAHDERITTVLGNHDLHLIAVHLGISHLRKRDTLDEILAAPDADELISWLRAQPFAHREGRHLLVHAGLLPRWTEDDALERSRLVSAALHDERAGDLVHGLRYETTNLDPAVVARAHDAAVLTRLRVCTAEGVPALAFKGPPAEAPAGHRPWFDHPHRRDPETRVVFGHWAALGGPHLLPGVIALDSGCVWGRSLTALRLDDGHIVQQATLEPPRHDG